MTSVSFAIPTEQAASGPPESRGLERDQVRLMVATPDGLAHSAVEQLDEHLLPGDLVVVNNSATLPAAVDAIWEGQDVVAHFSTRLDPTTWVIELRQTDGAGPILDANPGDTIEFNEGRGVATLRVPASGTGDGEGTRLWRTRLYLPSTVEKFLGEYGRPIRYDYLSRSWPLQYYQTIFSRPDDPSGASAEMPSASRPFSTKVVNMLIARGVRIAHITLHAGVSSLEHHEPPQPERYVVPARTAKEVRAAQRRGSRVVAAGTTVTRALETVATPNGSIAPGRGWTELVLGPDRPTQIVDGLITGWHPPQASHLLLLEAVAGRELVDVAYRSALDNGYLWHEFGDSCLFLP